MTPDPAEAKRLREEAWANRWRPWTEWKSTIAPPIKPQVGRGAGDGDDR